MNALQETIAFCAAETGRRDVLAVPRPLLQLLGSADAAVVVAQLLAWTEREADAEGWVVRSFAAWEAATTLSRHRVQAVVGRCRALGIVETRRDAIGDTRRYRVLLAPLLRALAATVRRETLAIDGTAQRPARRPVRLPAQADPVAWQRAPSRQPARQWDERHRGAPLPANGHGARLLQKSVNVGNLGNLGNLAGSAAAPFDSACWAAAQAELVRKIPAQIYDRCLRDSHFASVEGQTVVLRAPSVNAAWWLNARLTRPVARAVNLVAPGPAWLSVEARV